MTALELAALQRRYKLLIRQHRFKEAGSVLRTLRNAIMEELGR